LPANVSITHPLTHTTEAQPPVDLKVIPVVEHVEVAEHAPEELHAAQPEVAVQEPLEAAEHEDEKARLDKADAEEKNEPAE
jgi:hypothetical protein